jgi:hypothetical protein
MVLIQKKFLILCDSLIFKNFMWSSAATKRLLSDSLIVLGKIGGNDYNFSGRLLSLQDQQPRGLRRVPLPQVVQRLLPEAQPGAKAEDQPAQVTEPRREDHLRRLLRRRHGIR